MKKKYLEPRCRHLLWESLQLLNGSVPISDEEVGEGWARESGTDETNLSIRSVWDD